MAQVNAVLASHDHINIATKFQKNQPREPPEDSLNRTPENKDIKKRPEHRWRHETGWSQSHVWWLRIGRDISAAEIPTEEQRVSVTHQAPKPRDPVLGKVVSTTANCEDQQRFHSIWVRQTASENRSILLKGLCSDSFIHSQALTLSSSEGTAAQKAPETYREKLNCVAVGRGPPLSLC